MVDKKQSEASNYIRNLLSSRNLHLNPRTMTFEDNKQWIVYTHQGRELGIDTSSGVWVRASINDSWRCLATPCNVSGALQAVEFLCG
jgi:hypothetical protein